MRLEIVKKVNTEEHGLVTFKELKVLYPRIRKLTKKGCTWTIYNEWNIPYFTGRIK